MSNRHDRRRLDQLRADLHRVLEPVLRGTDFVLPRSGSGRDATAARRRASGVAGDLSRVPGSPGDERRIRALAKEIKRLITEDSRRGIGV